MRPTLPIGQSNSSRPSSKAVAGVIGLLCNNHNVRFVFFARNNRIGVEQKLPFFALFNSEQPSPLLHFKSHKPLCLIHLHCYSIHNASNVSTPPPSFFCNFLIAYFECVHMLTRYFTQSELLRRISKLLSAVLGRAFPSRIQQWHFGHFLRLLRWRLRVHSPSLSCASLCLHFDGQEAPCAEHWKKIFRCFDLNCKCDKN